MPRRWIDSVVGTPCPHRTVLSRRDLLQAGLAATTGLLSADRTSISAQQPQRSRRIVVVGAGFSGLACAYELVAAGYSETLFEARNRVGGRVLSVKELIPGKIIEGGGELLGSNHPHVLAYAAKFGFEFLAVTEEDAPKPMTKERIRQVESIALQKLRKLAQDQRLEPFDFD